MTDGDQELYESELSAYLTLMDHLEDTVKKLRKSVGQFNRTIRNLKNRRFEAFRSTKTDSELLECCSRHDDSQLASTDHSDEIELDEHDSRDSFYDN